MIGRWRRLAAEALDRRFGPLYERLDALEARLATQQAALDALTPVVRTLAADDPGHRRRLHALRADPGYAAAWDEPDPLVTISIPTRNRPRLLVERSLASALAQTHEHLEVIVVGDAAGPEIAAAVEAVGDPRVRFVNLTHQFVREDGEHWLTAATLTRNEAYRLARGHWLVDLDDDDALRPGAVAALLDHARAERLEVVYGVLEEHHPDGATTRLGGINLHGSLLPKFRGAAPVQWAILRGEAETGNSVIHMTPGLDAGPLLAQQRVPIDPDEDSAQLEQRLAALGASAVLDVVAGLEPRIRSVASSLIAQCAGKDEVEVVGDYALKLPAQFFLDWVFSRVRWFTAVRREGSSSPMTTRRSVKCCSIPSRSRARLARLRSHGST